MQKIMADHMFSHKCAHIMLVCTHTHTHTLFIKSATFIGSMVPEIINEGVQKAKRGHVTCVCKGSYFALSPYPSKMMCAVLDV